MGKNFSEADAIADPPVAIGIVGKNKGDPPVSGRCPAQLRPIGGKVRNESHTIRGHFRHDDAALRHFVEAFRRLERDRAGKDTPVHFGQRDVHCQIAWA